MNGTRQMMPPSVPCLAGRKRRGFQLWRSQLDPGRGGLDPWLWWRRLWRGWGGGVVGLEGLLSPTVWPQPPGPPLHSQCQDSCSKRQWHRIWCLASPHRSKWGLSALMCIFQSFQPRLGSEFSFYFYSSNLCLIQLVNDSFKKLCLDPLQLGPLLSSTRPSSGRWELRPKASVLVLGKLWDLL